MIGGSCAVFSLEKLFIWGSLVGRSAVAAPAGHPLGDIVPLANPKLFAQPLVDQLGHVFWDNNVEAPAFFNIIPNPIKLVRPNGSFNRSFSLLELNP